MLASQSTMGPEAGRPPASRDPHPPPTAGLGLGPGSTSRALPWSTHHGVAQEEDGKPWVVLLHNVHVLQHVPDENLEVRHHHPLPLALPVANWKRTGNRTSYQRLTPAKPRGLLTELQATL